MLKKLSNIYNRLISYFIKKSNKNLFTIQINILSNNDIDIKLIYDIHSIDDSEIITTAEKYAELLIYLGTRVFKQDLYNVVGKNIKNSNNVKEQLLLDNILFFYETIKQHIQSNHSSLSNSPVIKPSQVFNLK
jgi:hemerythrin-like domain-containing protein